MYLAGDKTPCRGRYSQEKPAFLLSQFKKDCTEREDPITCLTGIFPDCPKNGYTLDSPPVESKVTAYLAPSSDKDARLFSVPVLFSRRPDQEFCLDPKGSNGAVHAVIERIKQKARQVPGLAPHYGAGTRFPKRYDATIEPYTVTHSDDTIGVYLWHPDDRNFADEKGIHLLVRGALPCLHAGSAAD